LDEFDLSLTPEQIQALRDEFEPLDPTPEQMSSLLTIDWEDVRRADSRLRERGIQALLDEARGRIVDTRGVAVDKRAAFVGAYERRHQLELLLDEGYTPLFHKEFENSGVQFKQSRDYRTNRPFVNHSIQKLVASGRALVFSFDEVAGLPEMAERLHLQPVVRAEKHNDFVGRICLNCTSRAGPARHALNSYADVGAMDIYRPLVPNPLVTDLCNLAVDVRDRHGAKVELSGATVDIRTAYEQYFHSGDVPLLFGTVVEVECDGVWKKVVVAWVGGCYGFVRGGYAYSEIQQFLDYAHNRDGPRESVTYVDDGLIITVSEAIEASTARYQDAARQILGDQSIKAEKTKVYDGHLVGIGWHFDFVKWTVRPKDMARRRLLYRWWVLLHSCESAMRVSELQTAVAALVYYSQVMPVVKAFIPSVRRVLATCGARTTVKLPQDAKDDFEWIMVFVWVLAERPDLLESDITTLSQRKKTNYLMYTDASTEEGCGGVISELLGDDLEGESEEMRRCVLRWHPALERLYIRNFTAMMDRLTAGELVGPPLPKSASINVLEYFAVVNMVVSNVDLLRGSVVHCKCDNTAAVAWLNKLRGTSLSPLSIALSCILSFVTHAFNITIISAHIAGVHNVLADYLSRDEHLQETFPLPSPSRVSNPLRWIRCNEEVVQWQERGETLGKIGRTLLAQALSAPSQIHGLSLLALVSRLDGKLGPKRAGTMALTRTLTTDGWERK
jgi:hypothetical protein